MRVAQLLGPGPLIPSSSFYDENGASGAFPFVVYDETRSDNGLGWYQGQGSLPSFAQTNPFYRPLHVLDSIGWPANAPPASTILLQFKP